MLLKKRQKQLLLNKDLTSQKEFGGAHLKKSHAKTARPISTKKAMHLTLRSTKAKGARSFLATRQRSQAIEKIIRTQGAKYGVKIYQYANVGNHLHLLIRATYRRGFIAFLRAISGLIARLVLGAERGSAKLKESTKFWDQRPWTRILAWMQDFRNVREYVKLNFNEAMGFLAYRPRNVKLKTIRSTA